MTFWPTNSLINSTTLTPKIVITMPSGLTIDSTCSLTSVSGLSPVTCTAN